MQGWEYALLAVAIIVGVAGYCIGSIFVKKKYRAVPASLVAIAAIIVVWIVMRHNADDILDRANGDRRWADKDWVRPTFIAVLAILGGYGIWILTRSRTKD